MHTNKGYLINKRNNEFSRFSKVRQQIQNIFILPNETLKRWFEF